MPAPPRSGAATLHEAAGKVGALPHGIHCLTTGLMLAGRAVTVSGPPGDNLWLHRGVYAAAPGDVLVVEPGQDQEAHILAALAAGATTLELYGLPG